MFGFQSESTIYKNGAPIFDRKTDLCDKTAKKSDILKAGLGLFAIPFACPFNKTQVFCYKGQKVVTFSESMKRLISAFPLSGNTATYRIVITHGNGKSSCFETESEIEKVE